MKKLTSILIAAILLTLSATTASAKSTTSAFDIGQSYGGAVLTDGTLMMWGKNKNGEFGNGVTSTPDYDDEVQFVITQDNMAAYSLGQYSTSYMLDKGGVLWACGKNDAGQVGNGEGSYDGVLTPSKVAENVVKVEGGSELALFLKSDGTLWGIGDLSTLRLGRDLNRSYEPYRIYDNVQTFSCGRQMAALITTDGKLYSAGNGALWSCGANTYGTLLNGETGEKVYTLTKVIDSGVQSVVSDSDNAVYITENGTLYGTGNNVYDTLGHRQDYTVDGKGTISQIAGDVTDVAIGWQNMLYRTTDGTLYITGGRAGEKWGMAFAGQKKILDGVAENKPYTITSGATDENHIGKENLITLQIGSKTLIHNGVSIELNVPARAVHNRTLVPVRAVAESFGSQVDWDGDTQTVTIKY